MAPLARLKSSWLAIVQRVGEAQTTVVLTLIYSLVLGPIALLLRAFRRGDLLELQAGATGSFARRKTMVPTDAERCARPF